ncbi:MAG: hypothetical protein K6E26_07105 [Clostridiales bacterium]|nr:hypothetical protein [Clostridiales bacterium]
MKKEDLFGIISDIDDKYILEAHEEDLAAPESAPSEAASASTENEAHVTADTISKRPGRIRILLPIAAGIAALALVFFGLWKADVFEKKEEGIIEHKDTVIVIDDESAVVVVTDDTGTNLTSACVTAVDPTGSLTTSPTIFSGWAKMTVRVSSDNMIEKDGKMVPSELLVTFTNLVDDPCYYDSSFLLQKLNDEGEWETCVKITDGSTSRSERCVAGKYTTDFPLSILFEHYELWDGPARLLVDAHFYEPDENDWTEVKAPLYSETLAAEFYF